MTPADPLSPKDRRDVVTFLVALVLGLTIVAVVVIAKGSWKGDQWGAIAALAASIQAVGVIAALVYAKREIDNTRADNEQRRIDERLRVLESTFFDELQPAHDAMTNAVLTLRAELELYRQVEEETVFDPPPPNKDEVLSGPSGGTATPT